MITCLKLLNGMGRFAPSYGAYPVYVEAEVEGRTVQLQLTGQIARKVLEVLPPDSEVTTTTLAIVLVAQQKGEEPPA